ncbi:MAG: caspase family protein [Candidatus Aminicenantes bacterium]|nr:caspase family protein [Candidatus Aminicenantes bacterium]
MSKKRILKTSSLLVFLVMVILYTPLSAQQKYALLISTGNTILDDQPTHSEYWYDLFLIYRTLIENGFTHDNIYVLYGNGNDFASAYADYQTAAVFPGVAQIVDFSVSRTDVQNIFTWLANGNAAEGVTKIQDGDFLFYWWMGHGSIQPGMGVCDYRAKIEVTNEYVTDTEFAAYFGQLPDCVVKTDYVMTCHSGGLIADLEGLHTMIHTAAPCDTGTNSLTFDVIHAEFSYHVASAFREEDALGAAVASDTDLDGLVSAGEANDYVHTNMTTSVSQIGDYRNIAPLIFIANAQPDALIPLQGVYSRDYAEDDGTEPSEYMSYVWYHGPDLWVRNFDDGITTPQDPEFGQPNYVYARIHNIGCALLNNVTVDFSWCTISAWASPASWNPINTLTVNNFQSGDTKVISTAWNTVPAPGGYCLHTVLNAPGDPNNADGRSFMDNNKVQINVDVVNNVWGWRKNFHWLLENALESRAAVDLVIEKLNVPFPTEMGIKLPPKLSFKRAVGGEIKQTEEGMVFFLDPRKKQAAIRGIMLEPLAKMDASLSVVTSKKMQIGEKIIVKVSEQHKGLEVGGIIFKAKTAPKHIVLSDFFKRLGVAFRELEKRFSIKVAPEIFQSSREVRREMIISESGITPDMMMKLIKLEEKAREDLVKHMKKPELRMFDLALKNSYVALKEKKEGLFVESQEELIMSTVPMFMRHMKKMK